MILKKVSLSIASIMVVASVAACSSGNVPSSVGINGGADFKGSNLNQIQFNKLVQNLNSQGEKPTIVDMGYKGGASFAIKIKPAATGSSFSIKDNVQGHKFVAADVAKARVFLFAANSFTPGIEVTPHPGSESTLNKTVTSRAFTVVFTNVPGNANPWRVAVASLTSGDRNITKNVNSFATSSDGGGFFAVSSTGGDSNSGSLAISPLDLTFASGSEAALGIETTLIDADGASIDSETEVTDGSTTPSGTLEAN